MLPEKVNQLIRQIQANDASVTKIDLSPLLRQGHHDAAITLLEALKTNNVVKFINIRRATMSKAFLTALADALKLNRSVMEMSFRGNKLGENDGITLIAEILMSNHTIRKINLYNNRIDDNALKTLAAALRMNGSLTHINLSDNYFGDEGVIALADALMTNSAITEINLMNNLIGQKAVLALSEMIMRNKTISTLSLPFTECVTVTNHPAHAGMKIWTTTDLKPIFEALKTNNVIVRLEFGHYHHLQGDVVAFRDLENLRRATNSICRAEVKSLAQALEVNRTITHINPNLTDMGGEGAEVLLMALQTNYSVRKMNLEGCFIFDEDVIRKIDRCLSRNKMLNKFNQAMRELGSMIASDKTDLDAFNGRLEHAQTVLKQLEQHAEIFLEKKCQFDSMVIKAHLSQGQLQNALKHRKENPNIDPDTRFSLAESMYANMMSFRDRQTALSCIVDLFRDKAVRSLPLAMAFIGPVIWQIQHPGELYQLGLHITDQDIEDFFDPFNALEATSAADYVGTSFFSKKHDADALDTDSENPPKRPRLDQ